MRRLLIAAALALSLPACTGLGALTSPAPAPLARTAIDDTALETAWKAFDVALDALNLLGDAGAIVPGSPTGKAVASGIRAVNRALASAERFAAAGSATDYRKALEEAEGGMEELRAALKGGK